MPLELTIVTADKRFHFPRVAHVVIPTLLGQVGILPGHAPLISLTASGVLRIHSADPDQRSAPPILFAIDTGMARIADDHIVLLLSEAYLPQDIHREKTIARSHELATARTGHAPLGAAERKNLEEEAAFNKAQLDVLDAASSLR